MRQYSPSEMDEEVCGELEIDCLYLRKSKDGKIEVDRDWVGTGGYRTPGSDILLG